MLLGTAQNAEARTLVFTYSDDGTDSSITADGSLDLSGLETQHEPATQPALPNLETARFITANYGPLAFSIWHTIPACCGATWYINRSEVTISGGSSYEGIQWLNHNRFGNFTSSYSSEILIYVVRASGHRQPGRTGIDLFLPSIHVANNIYNPTGKTATFPGTLANVMKDDDFHVVYDWGHQKIIFTTAATTPAKPDLTATQGDGQVTLNWPDPSNSSNHTLRDSA